MSKLKINEDQYLGKQELNRLQKFLSDDGFKTIFGSLIGKFGILTTTNYEDSLKIKLGSTGGFISLNKGFLVDSNFDFVNQSTDIIDAIEIPDDGSEYYVFIEYESSNNEEGYVTIQTDGTINGIGTKFTEVLRAPLDPVKIRFSNSSFNVNDYEVVSVENDTRAVVAGTNFTSESNIKFIIIGGFSPGIVIPDESKFIYEYDSINVVLKSSNTPSDNQYVVGKVKNSSGVVTIIEDLRGENKVSFNEFLLVENNIAFINRSQLFTGLQRWGAGTSGNNDDGRVNITTKDGNLFVVETNDDSINHIQSTFDDVVSEAGTVLFLMLREGSVDSISLKNEIPAPPDGYSTIYCHLDLVFEPNDVLMFLRIKDGSVDGWQLLLHTKITSQINEKVNKESGKGLSTNDFTDSYKDKLDGLTDGSTTELGYQTGRIQVNGADLNQNEVVETDGDRKFKTVSKGDAHNKNFASDAEAEAASDASIVMSPKRVGTWWNSKISAFLDSSFNIITGYDIDEVYLSICTIKQISDNSYVLSFNGIVRVATSGGGSSKLNIGVDDSDLPTPFSSILKMNTYYEIQATAGTGVLSNRRPAYCEFSGFTIALYRLDGSTWSDGQYVSFKFSGVMSK